MDQKKMKTAWDLIYLVSCAVNNEKPDLKKSADFDLADIFSLARRHSLTAAASISIEQVTSLPLDFKEEKYKVVRRLILFDIERKKVLDTFEKSGIRYVPLKGIVLKDYYPKAIMREMSDNDILCDSDKLSEIKKLMEELGYLCKSFGKYHHDVYVNPSGVEFEIHHSLFNKIKSPDLYVYFGNIRDRLIKDDNNDYGFHMTNEDFYIYIICHLLKHYKQGGTGLRSLLDVYVFNRRFGDSLDSVYLGEELKKLELIEFESEIKQLAVKVFTGQNLSDNENAALEFFTESNTYGTPEHVMMWQLNNNDSEKAKRKYVLGRLFPSNETLKTYYPFIYRHKYLYPFWNAHRLIKGALYNRKKISGEVKRLKKFKTKDKIRMYDK